MKTPARILFSTLVGFLFVSAGFAEEFDYEVGLAFDSTKFDGMNMFTLPGGTAFNSSEIDTDDFSLFGTWYFSGLSDDNGPRSRALLVDRASSLTFNYARSEQTAFTTFSSTDPAIPFPPFESRFETQGDSYGLDLRYVDRDSGWFGEAGYTSIDLTVRGEFGSFSSDGSEWRLGVGKYLFETTTLSFNYGEADSPDLGDATAFGVAVEHLGDLGTQWQYAVDLDYSSVDLPGGYDTDSWSAAFTLFPSRDFEFGIGYENASAIGDGEDLSGVKGFVNWFVTPSFSLGASYREDDPTFLGNLSSGGVDPVGDADQSSIEITARYRF